MTEKVQKVDDPDNGNLAKVEKQLTKIDPKIFEGIPNQKKQQIMKSLVVTMHKTHIGPLPDPETLSEYSAIIPNGAERIMKMTEKQLDHRMQMENKVVGGQMFQSNLGQIFAFLIGLAALGSSTYCIVSGYEWGGSIIGIGGLTSLVTAFIKGRSSQEKNLEEKSTRVKR
jgi:uncharacterized membrane protein